MGYPLGCYMPFTKTLSLGPHGPPLPCRADCGAAPNTTRILVRVSSNFAGHPLLAPRVLMAAAAWNLCLLDSARRRRGDADLCW